MWQRKLTAKIKKTFSLALQGPGAVKNHIDTGLEELSLNNISLC